MNLKFITIFIFFLNSLNSTAYAKGAKAKASTTRITSEFIDIKKKSQKIDFLNNVVVKNGPDMMTSNKMTLFYLDKEQKKQNQGNSIDKIIAKGDIKVFSSEFVATSDDGHYDPKRSTFTLENNVVVNNGDSIGTGDKFIYSLKTRQGNFVSKHKRKRSKSKKDNRVTITISKDAKRKKK